MIRSVARHCEPPHNWTRLSSTPSPLERVVTLRQEPHSLNGPVPSRMISAAVPHSGTLLPRDTAVQVSDSSKSTGSAAERRQMFEATDPALAARHLTGSARRQAQRLPFRNSSSRRLNQTDSSPGNREAEAAPSREFHSLPKNSAKLHRATNTYCLT